MYSSDAPVESPHVSRREPGITGGAPSRTSDKEVLALTPRPRRAGTPAELLALQRTAGNHAVGRVLRKRKRPDPKPVADLERLRVLSAAATARRDLLASYLKTARDDLARFRARFREVNARNEAAYATYKATLKSMNASIDTEQFIINQVFSMVNNVTLGALGNALQEAKRISAAVNLYAGSAVNTAAGNLTPQIPKAEISDEVNPALRRADGLQKLDDLNATVLGIAADGLVPVSEPMKLAEKLIAEVRVASARGKRELTDAEVRKGVAELEGYQERGASFVTAVLAAHQQLDKLRGLFNRSPFPSERRCEQDIWITWMSHQDPGWGFPRWTSVLGRPELHARLIAVGLATYDIGFTPGQPESARGGRLGVATKGLTDRPLPNGQVISKDPAHWLKDASLNELPRVGQYWASVFLGAEPPYIGKEY
jgi:hypothetical protein